MKKFVTNGEVLEKVVFTTQNVVIQKVQEGKKREKCYIIGNGFSLNVDERGMVKKHDPGMLKFNSQMDKESTVYAFYFTFECSGLEESSKEIADFVNKLPEKYEQIFLVGHSKCGVCLYDATRYCEEESIILVTISTPFNGTFIADKNAVEKKLKFSLLKKIYNVIFSDHNVDRDIRPNSSFIKKNRNYVPRCKHINITSSLKGILKCNDVLDVLLLILDKILNVSGDGIVPLASQQKENTVTFNIICSHSNSLKKGIEVVNKFI